MLPILDDLKDQVLDDLKSAAVKLVTEKVLSLLVSQFPWLAGKLVNPILGFIVQMAAKWLVKNGIMLAEFTYIDYRTSTQGQEFETAAKKHAEALAKGAKDEIEKAAKAKLDAARALIRWTRL